MPKHFWLSLPALLLLTGCASTPLPEYEYAQVTGHVSLAACEGDLGVPAALPPEGELSGPHPLDFYLQVALERNPRLLAAQRAVAAEAETIPQVTSLENPMLNNTLWPDPDHSPQTASGRWVNGLMLTQEFPWLSKLRVRGEVAEQETKIALTQLAQAQLEVTEQVRLAYYEIYYYQQAVAITEENENLLQDLVELARIRFRTGGSQQDVLRAELELERLRNQLIDLRQQLRVAQADLAALLHASPDAEPLALERLVIPPTPERIEQLYEIAVHCRPELQERLHAIVRDQRRRELAALDYYPDFAAGLNWQVITDDQALATRTANGNDNFGLIVGVSLPIWQDRLRAGVREAEHRTVASARLYDAERDDTFRQIRRLVAQIDAYERQMRLFRESILPKAEQTLQVSLADYRTGKVDFLDVIDNYSELLMFQVQLARLQASLGQALASLERAVGCQLATLPETAVLPAPELAPGPAEVPAPAPGTDEPQPDGGREEGQNPNRQERNEKVIQHLSPRRIVPAGYTEPDVYRPTRWVAPASHREPGRDERPSSRRGTPADAAGSPSAGRWLPRPPGW